MTMAHPFMPMTNEILKKLTRMMQDYDSTNKSPELPTVFETQEQNSKLELNPQRKKSQPIRYPH
jgi:hypothetical protein